MKKNTRWRISSGPYRIRIDRIEGEAIGLPRFPITGVTWKRALRLKTMLGTEKALQLIDQRAWKAFNRGDDATSRRWRNLIIAIHAMEDDELMPGERSQ